MVMTLYRGQFTLAQAGRTGQHPFGGVKPSFARMANAKKNNIELLQSLFFDGRRVVPMNVSFVTLPETYLSKLRGVNQNVLCFARIMSTLCQN